MITLCHNSATMNNALLSTTPPSPEDDIYDPLLQLQQPAALPVEPATSASPSPPSSLDPPVLHAGAPASPAKQEVVARQPAPPRRTDHTYHDFSTHTLSPYEYPSWKKSKSNFPAKLHRMISDPANANIIQWQPHGRGKPLSLISLLRSNAVSKTNNAH